MRLKRRRGGQPGNQNARKHGFYSPYMSRPEISELNKILVTEGIEKTVAFYRLKLISALRREPGNRRLIREAAALLANWYCAQYGLYGEYKTLVKKFIRHALQAQANCQNESYLDDIESPGNAGTNQAESGKVPVKTRNELKLKNHQKLPV